MHLIDQIADFLANQGLGTVGVSIFTSYLPQTPDNAIAVIETGGLAPNVDIPTKEPTFQVMVRNTNFSDGRTNLDTVRSALHQKRGFEVYSGETYFYFIYAISEGGHIGRDDNGRDEFSINFRCRTR